MESGETIIAAAKRETKEEAGYDIDVCNEISSTRSTFFLTAL